MAISQHKTHTDPLQIQTETSSRGYHLKNHLQVRHGATPEEYMEILALRYETYFDAGKIANPSRARTGSENMARSLDFAPTSKMISFWLGAVLVGSFRISIPTEEDVLESIEPSLGFYPSDFPQKSKVIEVSFLCVRSGYRRTDIFKLVCEQVHAALVEAGRSHILICADKRLQKKYRWIGFSNTKYSYEKPNSRYSHIQIMISNQKPAGIYGLNADPIRWNIFLRDVTDRLVSENKLSMNLVQKLLFGPYGIYRGFRFLEKPVDQFIAFSTRRRSGGSDERL